MIRDFFSAFKGKLQWDDLYRRNMAEYYIFMPHQKETYNDLTLRYLDAYMKKEKKDSVCVITCDCVIYKKLKARIGRKNYKILPLFKKKEWIDNIIKFYALYEFSNKVKIISLTEPYYTCGENLLGVHGITKTELFCYDILGLTEIPD